MRGCAAPGDDAPPARLRALVVDDEPENLDYLRRCLYPDFEVVAARSAEEGLALLAADPFEIIISDQRMPGMSGSQFLTECLRQNPTAVRIIVTAYSDLEGMVQAINDAKIGAFLRKPFAKQDLKVAISNARPASENRFRELVEHLPDGVLASKDGRVLYANPALAKLAQLDSGERLVGQTWLSAFHADDRVALAALGEGEVSARLLGVDGGTVAVAVARSPLSSDAGQVVRVRAVLPDSSRAVTAPRRRVLVADREARVAAALRRGLSSACDVVAAPSLTEVRRELDAGSFDLVLLDSELTEGTPEELVRLAFQLRERLVLTSAWPDSWPVEPVVHAHGVRLLHKPFELSRVLELLPGGDA